MDAQISERNIPETISGLSKKLYKGLSKNLDDAHYAPDTEFLFKKKVVTREKGHLSIFVGEAPKKILLCHIFWKKQEGIYLFKIRFEILEGSKASLEYLNSLLSCARDLLNDYFKTIGIKPSLRFPMPDPFA